ncbi:MAG TPA: hypothetical protein VMU51_01555 [Mycobacteriales bacterium]|nr:hypothetical protein [Mycobacteriales bacterium]
MRTKWLLTSAATVLATVLPTAAPARAEAASAGVPVSVRAVGYRLVDLGTLGGWSSTATAVNDRGEVVGASQTATGDWHAFRWSAGVLTDLGVAGTAIAINAAGQVLGTVGSTEAFLWSNGVLTRLGTLGGGYTYVSGLNDAGQVIGASGTTDGDEHAFVWSHGRMIDIGPPGYPASRTTAINNRGEVVGYAIDPKDSAPQIAFRWRNGVLTTTSPPDCGQLTPAVINDRGDEVGWGFHNGRPSWCLLTAAGTVVTVPSYGSGMVPASLNSRGLAAVTSGNGLVDLRAAVLSATGARRLDTPQGWSTIAVDINDPGQVTGYHLSGEIIGGDRTAMAWTSGRPTRLPIAGWTSSWPAQINNHGWIAGTVYRYGATHAVVWEPVFSTRVGLPPQPAPLGGRAA